MDVLIDNRIAAIEDPVNTYLLIRTLCFIAKDGKLVHYIIIE